jgi:hypothetical protein
MKLHCVNSQPSLEFGKRDESDGDLRARHFKTEHGKRTKRDDAPGAWGYVDTISTHDGKQVRQHADLTGDQAAQLVEQTLALQAAMLRHEMAHQEFPSIVAPMEEDEFVSSKGKRHHDVLKR